MVNCALVTDKTDLSGVGIYLNWYGNRGFVEAYLGFCKLKKYPSPETDCKGWACLGATISNHLNGQNVGICHANEHTEEVSHANGIYIIKDWTIVARIHQPFKEKDELTEKNLRKTIMEINVQQPPEMQLTADERPLVSEMCAAIIKARDAVNVLSRQPEGMEYYKKKKDSL